MAGDDIAFAYHDATKHGPHQYARSPGYLDWASQPDPFRVYAGARRFLLPFGQPDDSPPYDSLFVSRLPPQALNIGSISLFLLHSMALSAWKSFRGEHWALRCNPSSGNLHPTEAYIVCGPIEGLCEDACVFHYAPENHGLEERLRTSPDQWQALAAPFPPHTFLVGLSSIHWREAWKYGERAYRYCQHDLGHAVGACAYAAAALGWRVACLSALSDGETAALLGLPGAADATSAQEGPEPERPGLVLAVAPGDDAPLPRALSAPALFTMAQGEWLGEPNELSSSHEDWSIIPAVDQACQKPRTEDPPPLAAPPETAPNTPLRAASAWEIIGKRRSAVDMAPGKPMPSADFYALLGRLMPANRPGLWSVFDGAACIHPVFFVHHVHHLPQGLYILVRHPDAFPRLQQALRPIFPWSRPHGCPAELPFYLLSQGDMRRVAAHLCCGQDIAGSGVFCAAMLADFEGPIQQHGPWMYRRLFWEAGLLGQVLYLEAEAAGRRGTGIGCFFDDPTHRLLGIETRAFQSLYHFTVGTAVNDARLTTLPPYPLARQKVAGWDHAAYNDRR